jgi:hypothetical protein
MDQGMTLAALVEQALRRAGLAITGVAIGDPANRTTWRVRPVSLQAAAQPVIDAFDPSDPVERRAAVDAEVDSDDRVTDLIAALIAQWADVTTLVAAGKQAQAVTRVTAALRTARRARQGV